MALCLRACLQKRASSVRLCLLVYNMILLRHSFAAVLPRQGAQHVRARAGSVAWLPTAPRDVVCCAGGRSVKGRQGPIVGVAPKRTRPLNAVEIVENWDILRDACTVKHRLHDNAERSAVRDAVGTALCQALGGVDDVPLAAPQAYASVQQAVNASRSTLSVLSPYPEPLTRAVLACCGYEADGLRVCSPTEVESASDLTAEDADDAHAQIHVVMDSYPALRSIKARLLGKGGTDAFRESLQSQWGAAASEQPHAVKLHMCDWALRSPAMKAQASGDAAMHLLTDVGLAELLRVEDVDIVMDGVSWR